MFVKAISNQEIDRELAFIEIGGEVYGNVKSYNQDFMIMDIAVDIGETEYDDEGNVTDMEFINEKIRLKLVPESIEKVYCGCGNRATRYQTEPLCDECEYEEPEDFSYLSQTPWESD